MLLGNASEACGGPPCPSRPVGAAPSGPASSLDTHEPLNLKRGPATRGARSASAGPRPADVTSAAPRTVLELARRPSDFIVVASAAPGRGQWQWSRAHLPKGWATAPPAPPPAPAALASAPSFWLATTAPRALPTPAPGRSPGLPLPPPSPAPSTPPRSQRPALRALARPPRSPPRPRPPLPRLQHLSHPGLAPARLPPAAPARLHPLTPRQRWAAPTGPALGPELGQPPELRRRRRPEPLEPGAPWQAQPVFGEATWTSPMPLLRHGSPARRRGLATPPRVPRGPTAGAALAVHLLELRTPQVQPGSRSTPALPLGVLCQPTPRRRRAQRGSPTPLSPTSATSPPRLRGPSTRRRT